MVRSWTMNVRDIIKVKANSLCPRLFCVSGEDSLEAKKLYNYRALMSSFLASQYAFLYVVAKRILVLRNYGMVWVAFHLFLLYSPVLLQST